MISCLGYQVFPDGVLGVPEDSCLANVMAPCAFGIAANHESPCSEKGHLPCVRVQQSGTRAVTVARTADVFEFVTKKKAPGPGASLAFADVLSFFHKQQASDIAEFMKTAPMWTGTIGAGEALFLPPGVIASERAMTSDVMGVRIGLNTNAVTSAPAVKWKEVAERFSQENPLFSKFCEAA